MLSKKLAAVDKTRCVACGVCENTCPLGAVKVRCGCYAAVEAERCVGCGKCARLCPVGCIEAAISTASSWMTQCPNFRQARQPLQKPTYFSRRYTVST